MIVRAKRETHVDAADSTDSIRRWGTEFLELPRQPPLASASRTCALNANVMPIPAVTRRRLSGASVGRHRDGENGDRFR